MYSRGRDFRALIFLFLFGVFFECLVAAAIVHFFGSDDGTLGQWGLILAFFWVGSIFLMLLWHLEAWIWFSLFGRKLATDAVEAALKTDGLPVAPFIINSSDEYFELVANNEENPIAVRLKAVAYAASVASMSMPGNVMHGIRMRMVYEDAIKRL